MPPPPKRIWSVKELTEYLQFKLNSDAALTSLWLRGEISNFKHHGSGHMYFTLKDADGSIRCVMFRTQNARLGFVPGNGQAVLVRGYVALYQKEGQLQVYVEEMQPDGRGSLYLAFLELKARLETQGLFAPERKRPLPRFPRRVGVVTSPTGAVIRDIITVSTRRDPGIQILLAPAAVQGETAPAEIARAIEALNREGSVEVIIVGRGGGSLEELWAFNTERVALAIYGSKVPVVSAVGHETDFTIADLVADVRAATPSAAAAIVVPDNQDFVRQVAVLEQGLVAGCRQVLQNCRQRLAYVERSTVFTNAGRLFNYPRQNLDFLHQQLTNAVQRNQDCWHNSAQLAASRLQALSPLAILQRGYAICEDEQGVLIKDSRQVEIGAGIGVKVERGSLTCRVVAREVEEIDV